MVLHVVAIDSVVARSLEKGVSFLIDIAFSEKRFASDLFSFVNVAANYSQKKLASSPSKPVCKF